MAKTHGMTGTVEHIAWMNMKARCKNKNWYKAERYALRGITYCEMWESFENFYEDMGPCPPGHSLDRINNNMGYSKENCRWATQIMQQNNRSDNVLMNVDGFICTVSQASRITHIHPETIRCRLKRGWSDHDAFHTPPGETRISLRAPDVCSAPKSSKKPNLSFDDALRVGTRLLAELLRGAA